MLNSLVVGCQAIEAAERKADSIVQDFDQLRLDITMFQTDMSTAMGQAIGNVTQQLKEMDTKLEKAQNDFNDIVKNVSFDSI